MPSKIESRFSKIKLDVETVVAEMVEEMVTRALSELSGTISAKTAKKAPEEKSAPKKVAKKAKKKSAKKSKPLPLLEQSTANVLVAIESSGPEGMQAGGLKKSLGVASVSAEIAALLAIGKIRKTGNRRSTRYFAKK